MFRTTSVTLSTLISSFMQPLNSLILLLSAIALLLFLYGGVRFVWGTASGEKHAGDKQVLIWGMVALFVLFSLGGILRFIEIAFLGNPVTNSTLSSPTGTLPY